jgi:hypothetical protein
VVNRIRKSLTSRLEGNVLLALAHAKRLAAIDDEIRGIDFGAVYKAGKLTRRHGIRFHVQRKRRIAAIPEDQRLPDELHGFEVDVLQAHYTPHQEGGPSNPHNTFERLQPGISIGNAVRATTGTLGGIVRDAADTNRVAILSNWHVLCASPDCQAGEGITQPGAFDAGNEVARSVATLTRWAQLSSGYDAAIAAVQTSIEFSPEEFQLGITPVAVQEPELHMKLVKSGLSSGITHAVVDGIGGSYKMDYRPYGDAERWMDGIHLVSDPANPDPDVSLEGDSGALWIEPESKAAVALHFGGEDGLGPLADYAVAHPLSRAFDLLRVQLA